MKNFVVLIGVMFLASCNFFGSSDPNIVFDGSGYVEPSVDSSLTVGDSATLNNVVATINDSIITVRDGDDSGRRIFVNIMVRFENMADNQARINYGNMLVYDNDRRFRVLRRETIWLDSRTPKLRLDANESYDANFAFRVPDIVDGSIWWEPDEGTMFYIGNIGSGRL